MDPYRALHPTRRDFSYAPLGLRKNRLRLDFFLVNSTLISNLRKCDIAPVVSTSFFDHKSVSLDFTRNKIKPKPYINRTITDNPRTSDVVLAAFADTYLAHADPTQPNAEAPYVHRAAPVDVLTPQKVIVGRFMQLIREYNDLTEQMANSNGNTQLISLLIAEKNTEIALQRELLWDITRYQNLNLTCNADFFLESLVSNIKGAVISFQTWVKKTENLKKSGLVKRLINLHRDFKINEDEILLLETELNALLDAELIAKVRSMKLFTCLNNEKPTPLFLSLAKSSNSGKSLSIISNPDGTKYASDAERNEGIVTFFENIYRKPADEPSDFTHCIENFLGAEIVNNPIVANSKIANNEYELLERPLTVDELDDSVEKCNIRSAPGIDGLNNYFIKKFWHLLRIPLLNYATHCFTVGRLTTNFRSASIKLIPKKGDLTTLKNWRPISLLSNMYKIISRAINSRLNLIVNRICSRAQKDFNTHRYTQEVLINVIETIRFCNNNDISGALVTVDMAKAFDTLSHRFLGEVLNFFGLGPNIIRWLKLLGENRQACILLDDGTYSRNFSLDRGRAQGDNISPNTFNFAEQILLFKIELDPTFSGIARNFTLPHEIETNASPHFMFESSGETSRNESLADDNTILLLMNQANLVTLRSTLDAFGRISGLKCNFDKTMVMPIGRVGTPLNNYAGFTLSNSVKLLGMTINNDLDNVDDIFIEIGEKILNIILFWSRFRLTLCGRIAILKTLLIPQINYLGCILTPDHKVIDGLQALLDDFALNNIPCAASRRYLPPEKGGLGLIHIGTFLMAQKCSWVKQAHTNTIDNWRLQLKILSPGFNISKIRLFDVDKLENPILFNIVEGFQVFNNCYNQIGMNYIKSNIYCNPWFVRSKFDGGLLDRSFFGKIFFDLHNVAIKSLTYENCFTAIGFKSMTEFANMSLPLSQVGWERLRSALLYAKERFRNNNSTATALPPPKSIDEFLGTVKKGSKKFREIIDKSVYNKIDVGDLTSLRSFCGITGLSLPDNVTVEHFLSSWNVSFLDNNIREFIFKCRYNLLKTNDRLSRFLPLIDQTCFLCKCVNINYQHRESFSHFFRKCPVMSHLILRVSAALNITLLNNTAVFDQTYWFGNIDGTLDKNILLVYDVFRYHAWTSKRQKIFPTAEMLTGCIILTFQIIFRIKPSIRKAISNNNNLSGMLQVTG
jgi:hypothetical protein